MSEGRLGISSYQEAEVRALPTHVIHNKELEKAFFG